MISVENFYWILYENLLAPVDFQCRYYYPFGTTDQLSEFEYQPKLPKHFEIRATVLFHYDQEPIYEKDHVDIQYGTRGNSSKYPIMLANSERSDIKREMCREYQVLDWYYFYHGFAALDWFRDTRLVGELQDIVYPFSSLNHLVKNKRSYRMAMIARLAQRDLLDLGSVSFFGDFQDCASEIDDIYTELSDSSKQLIKDQLIDKHLQPLYVDSHDVDGAFSARVGSAEYRMRQRSFLHLVNETIFYDKKKHLTEKIFQPIVHLRPFMLVSCAGNLEYLRSYGFKTFGTWIDESYDTIEDNDLRLDHIANEVNRIANLPLSELKEMLDDMRTVLKFNKDHFFGEFRRIIVNELVDNFDQCLAIWNNGRVDDRSWARHPDPARVKKALLTS